MKRLWSLLRRWRGRDEARAATPIAGLELRARILADAMRKGAARSSRRGAGIEPDVVRAYSAGDDARSIDWRVTARRGELHVREFEEERDLDVLLLVDRSASLCALRSGLAQRAVREVTAALSLAAIEAGHRAGALFFTDSIEHYLAPSRTRDHWRTILYACLSQPSGRGTDLSAAVSLACRLLTSRGLVVVVSDFVHGLDAYRASGAASRASGAASRASGALAALASRHDVVSIVMRTPSLADLPSGVGSVLVRDAETGRTVLTGPARREAAPYARAVASLRALGVEPLVIDPRRDLGRQLRVRFGRARGRAA